MRILAIETSCDETAIAILEARNKKLEIKSNIVSSQVKIHKKWGGVVPTLAKREHQKNLVPVLISALKGAKLLKKKAKKGAKLLSGQKSINLERILEREEALFKNLKKFLINYQKPKIDLIAVTVGPGLEPALWVGINFAKALGYFWKLPIIPINHIKGHIFVNFLKRKNQIINKIFLPAICLSVAGGHTQLILMKDIRKYKLLGETRDDAAGECFDKVAKILGLGYPGGPIISKIAQQAGRGRASVSLPRPMINQKNYDFSFSGLKTAVLYDFRKRPPKIRKSKEYIREMCREVQQAIIDVLIKKTLKAAKDFKAKTIILGGGVVANQELRKQLKEACLNWRFKHLVPPKIFCTDNAVMVAIAAYFRRGDKGIKNWKEIKADANLKI
jgi:N6-L-threonylcarbamoyladenine synthase